MASSIVESIGKAGVSMLLGDARPLRFPSVLHSTTRTSLRLSNHTLAETLAAKKRRIVIGLLISRNHFVRGDVKALLDEPLSSARRPLEVLPLPRFVGGADHRPGPHPD